MNDRWKYAHALIVGGTGMLRSASATLAERSRRLTSVARTQRSLHALDEALPEGAGEHRMVRLDWNDVDGFLERLTSHLESTGPPDLVVAWIHGRELPFRLAAALRGNPRPRFFHVIGSASRSPDQVAMESRERFSALGSVRYRQVILGARGSGSSTRWLTDEEISTGVMEAIGRDARSHIVGTLDRWWEG